MDMMEKRRYWIRSLLFSLGLAPFISFAIGWLVSFNVTNFEGAKGYALVYTSMLSLPILILIIIILVLKKRIPYYISIPIFLISWGFILSRFFAF